MKEYACLARGFALAILLGGLSAGAAQAQVYTGTFTLPFAVRWGGAFLPKGGYSLATNSIAGPLSIVDASGRVRALVYGIREAPATNQPAALLLTQVGTERTVRSFNCPAWGQKFVYKPITRAERARLAEAGRTETVPVRMASR